MMDDIHQMPLPQILLQVPHSPSLCLVFRVSIPFLMLLTRKMKCRDVICLKSQTNSKPVDSQEFFSDAMNKLVPQRP